MLNKIIIGLSLCFSLTVLSQATSEKNWRFAFQLDNRFSSIRNTDITIFGIKTGVQYKNRTRFGIGASFIINPVSFTYFNKRIKEPETNKLSFWYVSVFDDFILYKKKHWECFVTEQIGYGKPKFVKEINDQIISDTDVGLYVNEISGQVNYRINSWFGLGTGIGYRSILNRKASLKNTFDAPIYAIKIIIHPETFLKKTKLYEFTTI